MNKHPDNAPEGICHAETVEACIAAIEAQKLVFASDEYATPQPSGSIVGRFACDQSIAAIRALPTTPANATRLTSDDVALKGPYPDKSPFGEIGRAGSPLAYLVDPGAGSGSDRATRYWPDRSTLDDIHKRGGDIAPLYARLASAPSPDTGDAMVEALRKHVATLADELEYALRDRYHLMLGYPEIERRFIREMASLVEARAALAVSRDPVQG